MHKKQYLAELTSLLSFLSEDERCRVISHISDKFEALGEGNEMELIAELGTPMKLAIAINRNGVDSLFAVETDPEEVAQVIPEVIEEEETPEEIVEEAPEEVTEEEIVEEIVEEEVSEPEEIPEPEPEPTPEPIPEKIESFPELDVARGISNEVENREVVYKTSAGGAILFTLLSIVVGIPLAIISLAFVIAVFLPAAIFVNFSMYGISAGFASLAFIPDAMLVFGGAFFAIGMTALLILLAFAITRLICKLWIVCTSGLWRKLVRKEV